MKKTFFQSIQKPKVFNIEIEMEKYFEDYHGRETNIISKQCYDKSRPKIENNQIKITKCIKKLN